MFGKKKTQEPVVEMPFEKEVLALEPGQSIIVFWKGKPIFMRPASVLDFDEVNPVCERAGVPQ